jgi:hypothetical protein
MPHHNRESARDFLRTENKFFVQPYMTHALPESVQQSMVHGGKWVDRSRLLPWKDLDISNALNITQRICILQENSPSRRKTDGYVPALSSSQSSNSYSVIKDFCDAYQMAQSDWIHGYLPPNAFSRGVLLTDEYLIFPNDVGSDPAVGCRYSGSLIPRKRGWGDANQNGQIPPRHRDATKITFAPVALLPSPIPILEKTHSNHGVRRLEVSKCWAPFLHVAGNDLFLGSYASQSEARRVVHLASAQSRKENCRGMAAGVRNGHRDAIGSEFENRTSHLTRFPDFDEKFSLFTPNAAHIADLFNTSAESVVSAFEEIQQPISGEQKLALEPPFRLREWVAQHYRHVQPQKESGKDVLTTKMFSLVVPVKCDYNIGNKRRKQSHPKRLH